MSHGMEMPRVSVANVLNHDIMLHIDLWLSRQYRIYLHRMYQCKQTEASHVGWQLEDRIGVMKLYLYGYPRQIQAVFILRLSSQ